MPDTKPICPKCGHNEFAKRGRNTVRQGHGYRVTCKKCRHTPSIHLLVYPSDGGYDPKITKKRLVITAAQNATPVFKPFWESLLTYCEKNDAQLLVIPYRYHNPTSIWSGKARGQDWWANEVRPYLVDTRKLLNKNLMLVADIKTQPTAMGPLTGFEALTSDKSGIIGHPKLELTTIPTPQNRLPKILTTTGACTKPNYVPGKAGKKGEFHHTYGACIVELEGGGFHIRQINAARDGSFMDIAGPFKRASLYAKDKIKQGGIEALVMGDSHLEFADPTVFETTFKRGGIVDTLQPSHLVWHDVHDFYSRNHHHLGEPFIDYVKHVYGTDDVLKMLRGTAEKINEVSKRYPDVLNIFVPSNHPDALSRWLKRADWKTDPRNARFILMAQLAMLESSGWDAGRGATMHDPFAHWMTEMLHFRAAFKFLKRDEGFIIKGVDVGQHGDVGPNGIRGSRQAFGKIGIKTVIGHSHSPGIKDGVYQVGTNGTLTPEFVKGPSSWLHTDCIIYSNGKRTLINIIDGKWRAQ